MLKKSWAVLAKGGYMAIVINDIGKDQFVEDMVEYVNENIEDAKYRGCIGYGPMISEEENSFGECQPVWVWRKN